MSDDDVLLEVGGETVSLADLASVNMDDVAEVRTSTFPAGAFQLKVDSAKLDAFGRGAERKAAVAFKFECMDVLALTDATLDANNVIGKFHQEAVFLTDPMEGLGRTKAFLADTGFKGTGQLQDLLAGFVGTEFVTRITHSVDKNDKSRVYSNIGLNIGNWKLAPVGGTLAE